jgi:hypothetical protein
MVEGSTLIAPQHIDQLRRFCADVISREDAGYDDMAPAAVSARARLAVANK